jgi:hypothetical protein
MQDDDGTMHIVGSKTVGAFSLDVSMDYTDSVLFSSSRCVRPRPNFHFEVDCSDAVWQQTAPAPLPRQIEQHGIYLPDMSFRALPGPTDER